MPDHQLSGALHLFPGAINGTKLQNILLDCGSQGSSVSYDLISRLVQPSPEIFQIAMAAGMPQGVGGTVQIGLPTVASYVWQAQKAGQAITLTGFVPSAEVKAIQSKPLEQKTVTSSQTVASAKDAAKTENKKDE